jgi:hypothetical protein
MCFASQSFAAAPSLFPCCPPARHPSVVQGCSRRASWRNRCIETDKSCASLCEGWLWEAMGLRSRQRPLHEFPRDTREVGREFSDIQVNTRILIADMACVIGGLAECTSGVSSTKNAGCKKVLKFILNFGIGKGFVLGHNGAERMNDMLECR